MQLTNLVGKQFGKLTVVEELPPTIRPNNRLRRYLKCLCVCGGSKVSSWDNLRSKKISNCGCDSARHGETGSKLYGVWHRIRQSCLDLNHISYKNYGGRGISFCPEWDSFVVFRDWANLSGYAQGLSIDRINNDGNYEPTNCRWTTPVEQCRNKRTNVRMVHDGKVMVATEFSQLTGISLSTVLYRIHKSKVYHAV